MREEDLNGVLAGQPGIISVSKTSFYCTLEACIPLSMQDALNAVEEGMYEKKMNILLVENDFYISELLTEVLTEHNFIVETVFHGLAPLQLVKKHDYDLIILNVVLPKLNGIDLCRKLRAEGYQMPILFWSSIDTPELATSAKEAGGSDYVIQPCKINTLLRHINNLLNRRVVKPALNLSSKRSRSNYLLVA